MGMAETECRQRGSALLHANNIQATKEVHARLCREEEAVEGSVNEIAFDELIATAVE